MYNSLTTNNYTPLSKDIKYLRVPISYFLDPAISINAAVILSLFEFRNQLSRINHRIHKGTPKDHYFNKQGGYVFIRFMMKELTNIFRGTGKKAIRNAINQLDNANYIHVDKPKHSWKRKNEYEILKKAYKPFDYAMSPKGTLQDTQKAPARINNTSRTNTLLKHKDTRVKDTRNVRNARKPAKLARPNLDKNIRAAKLNAQTERIKHQQNVNATNKLAKNTARAIHSPKTVRKIKEWSFNDPSRFKYYTGLMYAGKRWATYNFKHQKDMNHEDYKFLSWGLQFEYNDAYKTNDFAKEISDVITYTHSLPASQIKTTKYKYMRGWFTRIFMRYAEQYCNTHNPIRVAERKNEPDIPIGLSLSGSSADDDDVSSQIDYLDDQHVKLHPTSAKMQAKCRKQLAALNSRD